MIYFDPNLRESLCDSLDTAKGQFDYGMRYCDVLKISDNEIQGFTGEEDYDKGIAGSCLHFVLERGLQSLSENDLMEMLSFANAASSIITTKKGTLRVMPSEDDVGTVVEK